MMRETRSSFLNFFYTIYRSLYDSSFVFHIKVTRDLCVLGINMADFTEVQKEDLAYFIETQKYALIQVLAIWIY